MDSGACTDTVRAFVIFKKFGRKEETQMFKRFYRTIFTLLGLLCGTGIALLLSNLVEYLPMETEIPIYVKAIATVACIIITGLIFFIIAPSIMRSAEKAAEEIDSTLQKRPTHEVLISMGGLLIGLIFAFLISNLWEGLSMNVPTLGVVLSILVYIFFSDSANFPFSYNTLDIRRYSVGDTPVCFLNNRQK